MAKDDHALEVHHRLITRREREALGAAFLSAPINNHNDLSRILLTVMGMTASGKISPEQAEQLRAMSELLFTNICAQNIHNTQNGVISEQDNTDPLATRLKKAKAGAKKIRPKMLLDSEGEHEYELEILDKEGNGVPLAPRKK
jgi:hypothetical protein